MPLADDGVRPLHTSVVRLKSYGRGDDAHICKGKRPHLLFLTPDALQLFTTADAGPIDGDPFMSGDTGSGSSRGIPHPFNLRNITKKLVGNDEARPPTEAPKAKLAKTSSASELEDDEDLAEGQVFRLGVALNQLINLEVYKENQLIVWYQPNRPSKKRIGEDQTMMVLRGLMGALESVTKLQTGYGSGARPAAPHPSAHHFTIKFMDGNEANQVKEKVFLAQKQLAGAIVWLSEGLPLCPESSVVMVTVGPKGGGAAHAIPMPALQSEMHLPMEASVALAAQGSRRATSTCVNVYLSTPLGLAVAEIPLQRVMQSAGEGGAPFGVDAVLQQPLGKDTLRPGKRWQVMLSWKARRGAAILPPRPAALQAAPEEGAEHGARRGRSRSPGPEGPRPQPALEGGLDTGLLVAGGREVRQAQVYSTVGFAAAFLAVLLLALAFLASLTSLLPSFRGPIGPWQGGMGLLLGLAALGGVAGLARLVLARMRAPPVEGLNDGSQAQCFTWHLTLLEVDVVEETERQAPASPPVKRSLSVVGPRPPPSMAPGEPLPHHLQLLVEQYPGILTEDIARRFLIGLGSETKASAGLTSMAKWTIDNNLQDILHRPQPAFAVMKRHYPHGYPGWSRKKDCLVEVECMGMWPAAYTAIAAEGVSEQAMLEHLLFTYQYEFGVVDHRPMPDGKTVKIVDLGGLTMSDLRTPGFRLISRVGAMLSLNFPQRLHRCFLVNAPGWWAVAWRLISPIVPVKVRNQMTLFAKNVSLGAEN